MLSNLKEGHAHTQCNLGVMYENGLSETCSHTMQPRMRMDQDYEQAVKWYKKAALQGYAHAQFKLGLMYANGTGVGQDYKQAVKWYKKAARQGHVAAQYNHVAAQYNQSTRDIILEMKLSVASP